MSSWLDQRDGQVVEFVRVWAIF